MAPFVNICVFSRQYIIKTDFIRTYHNNPISGSKSTKKFVYDKDISSYIYTIVIAAIWAFLPNYKEKAIGLIPLALHFLSYVQDSTYRYLPPSSVL